MRKRVIPVLQISGGKLVKTRCFRNPRYVGDPINAVKIFNEKGVDELVLLDISATAAGREPDYDLIRDIASEAFMPLCYGGGITRIDQMRRLFATGIEKIAVNHAALTAPELLRAAAAEFGSQSVVASVTVHAQDRRDRDRACMTVYLPPPSTPSATGQRPAQTR